MRRTHHFYAVVAAAHELVKGANTVTYRGTAPRQDPPQPCTYLGSGMHVTTLAMGTQF